MIRLTGFMIGCLIIFSGVFFFKAPEKVSPDNYHNVENKISSDTGVKQEPNVIPVHQDEPLKEKSSPAVAATKKNNTVAEHYNNQVINSTPETTPKSQQEIFWQPFRSRYSANGFASRITRETGIQITVIELSPERFQVAFNYIDTSEQQEKLALIERITGLKIKPASKL